MTILPDNTAFLRDHAREWALHVQHTDFDTATAYGEWYATEYNKLPQSDWTSHSAAWWQWRVWQS